ncbi:hypothetical protein ALC57_18024, partial [Trachymyrmex cornetzi]
DVDEDDDDGGAGDDDGDDDEADERRAHNHDRVRYKSAGPNTGVKGYRHQLARRCITSEERDTGVIACTRSVIATPLRASARFNKHTWLSLWCDARRGAARRGEARRGETRRGKARRGEAKRGEADAVRQGKASRSDATAAFPNRLGDRWVAFPSIEKQ